MQCEKEELSFKTLMNIDLRSRRYTSEYEII